MNTRDTKLARGEFYERIAPLDLAPLWERLKGLVPREPTPLGVPHHWRYAEVRPFVMEAARHISAEEAERRVLLLENPGLRGGSQITNTLFAGLTPLESVAIAVLEREGHAHNWWRALPAFGAAIEEAHGLLAKLRLAPVEHRATRELAYGQQRLLEIALALATRPRVLLLDEPAAGVPQDESAELFAAIAGLSQELTVLFIEHDMNVVFRFAERIIVMVGGRILAEGTPGEVARDARVREVYLGKHARAA